MIVRAGALIALLLVPAVATYLSGYTVAGHYVALGTVLAFQVGIMARPVAPFALLVPVLYAAAAITAHETDGVAALIVAMAAAVGAASSQGYHRGLLPVLAAALFGSFEPAVSSDVLTRSAAMLAGSIYGFLIVITVARRVTSPARSVCQQTALSYALLLAVLVLTAWMAARAANLTAGWWLPLAAASVGEPYVEGSARRAAARLALTMAGTLVLLALIQTVGDPWLRAAIVLALGLCVFTYGRERVQVQSFLLTPIIVLFVSHEALYPTVLDYLRATLPACAVVFTAAVLGKWVLWTLRPDAGRVHA